MGEIVDHLERTKQTVKGSSGESSERYMLAMVVEFNLGYLLDNRLVQPTDLTSKQRKVFQAWKKGETDNWDSGDDGRGGEYGILDSIRWRPLKKRLPILSHFEN